ncbi:hypothetical protein AQ913_07360 [Burkholderia pseudomallei]|nr:hypothetical protein AQ913_07360 [Burkholderia pseudomallei]
MCCICRLLTGQFILKLGQFRMLRVVPVMNCSYVVHLSNAARELPPLEVKFFAIAHWICWAALRCLMISWLMDS